MNVELPPLSLPDAFTHARAQFATSTLEERSLGVDHKEMMNQQLTNTYVCTHTRMHAFT